MLYVPVVHIATLLNEAISLKLLFSILVCDNKE